MISLPDDDRGASARRSQDWDGHPTTRAAAAVGRAHARDGRVHVRDAHDHDVARGYGAFRARACRAFRDVRSLRLFPKKRSPTALTPGAIADRPPLRPMKQFYS